MSRVLGTCNKSAVVLGQWFSVLDGECFPFRLSFERMVNHRSFGAQDLSEALEMKPQGSTAREPSLTCGTTNKGSGGFPAISDVQPQTSTWNDVSPLDPFFAFLCP